MLDKIFTIYDNAAQAHLPPFFLQQPDVAKRMFADAINSNEHKFNKHPDHYTLFLHGTFDNEDASFLLQAAPKSLGNGLDFVQHQDYADGITKKEINEDGRSQEVSNVTPVRYDASG